MRKSRARRAARPPKPSERGAWETPPLPEALDSALALRGEWTPGDASGRQADGKSTLNVRRWFSVIKSANANRRLVLRTAALQNLQEELEGGRVPQRQLKESDGRLMRRRWR